MKIKHSHIHSFPSSPHSCPNLDVVVSSSDDGPNMALPTYIIKSKAQSPRPSGPLRGGKRKCETESTLKIEQHPPRFPPLAERFSGPSTHVDKLFREWNFLSSFIHAFPLPFPSITTCRRPRSAESCLRHFRLFVHELLGAHRRRRFGKRGLMGSWTTGAEKSMLIP